MDLQTILFLYLLIIFILFIFLYLQTFHFLEAFIISITIGLFFILITYPPGDLNIETEDLSCTALYIFIMTITLFIILIYAIYSAWRSRRSQDLVCVPKIK